MNFNRLKLALWISLLYSYYIVILFPLKYVDLKQYSDWLWSHQFHVLKLLLQKFCVRQPLSRNQLIISKGLHTIKGTLKRETTTANLFWFWLVMPNAHWTRWAMTDERSNKSSAFSHVMTQSKALIKYRSSLIAYCIIHALCLRHTSAMFNEYISLSIFSF